MDELADELGLDPIDLRLGSVNQPGDQTITGWEIGSCGVVACIEAVRERLNWDEARKLTGSGRGIGIAIAMHCSGAIVSPGTSRAEAVIEIGHNSGVSLVSGSSDPGTGDPPSSLKSAPRSWASTLARSISGSWIRQPRPMIPAVAPAGQPPHRQRRTRGEPGHGQDAA